MYLKKEGKGKWQHTKIICKFTNQYFFVYFVSAQDYYLSISGESSELQSEKNVG